MECRRDPLLQRQTLTHPRLSPYRYEFEQLPRDIIGDEAVRKRLEEGRELDEIKTEWPEELEGFLAIRKHYLIYA